MPNPEEYDPDNSDHRAHRNNIIKRSFLDTADRDYISARILLKAQLHEQYLWMALQAIEKYLKAILLFQDIPTKKIGHDLEKALAKACSIEALGMTVTEKPKEFIEYINAYGNNRYFTYCRFTEGVGLFSLDKVVWEIRRFCQDFHFPHESKKLRGYDEFRLKQIQDSRIAGRQICDRFIQNGFLEDVLDSGKKPELRTALVWKNFYYGKRRKNKVQYARWKVSSDPSLWSMKKIENWVQEHIHLEATAKRVLSEYNK